MSESQAPRNEGPRELERSYARKLEAYLAGGGEEALRGAYEIGRDALGEGRGLLDLAAMHHAALAGAARRRGAGSLERDLDRARAVLCECLSPYEMAQRGFQDAVQALRRLNATLEREVQRIAHAVHDEAGQLLVAARLALSAPAQEPASSREERLAAVGVILDQAEKVLRQLSHELRPTVLDDLGLVPALQFLADGFARASGLSVHVESALEGRAGRGLETALYRIVQEALANAARHSGARNVRIRLTRSAGSLRCRIRDDGAGFDVPAVLSRKERKGLGLLGMRERLNAVGGTLRISSEPGRGTELLVRVPLEGRHADTGRAR